MDVQTKKDGIERKNLALYHELKLLKFLSKKLFKSAELKRKDLKAEERFN